MWRMTLPNGGVPNQNEHLTSHERLSHIRHVLGYAIKPSVARCSICHIDLTPVDVPQGYCSDKDGCSCRAFSARCW